MIRPNPKAVEAVLGYRITLAEMREERSGNHNHLRNQVEVEVKRAEPHIRSQVLTELAEEFSNRHQGELQWRESALTDRDYGAAENYGHRADAFGDAATRCRELAAKEESDG